MPRGYLSACTLALLGLAPYVVLSTAFLPLQGALSAELGSGTLGFAVAGGLSSAGYAIGAVGTAQVTLRIMPRRVFLTCEAVFVVVTVLMAASPAMWVFAVARFVQGLAAGGLLISSLPPLITRFGAGLIPLSAGIVDVGIFGASTLGPLLGGWSASGSDWRWLLVGAAAVGAVGWVVALAAYDRWDPPEPERRVDRPALLLVVVTSVAVFAASSLVGTVPVVSWQVLGLFALAVVVLAVLLLVEARHPEPLVPVGALSTQLPVTGIFAAMVGGAVFVTLTEMLQTDLGSSAPGQLWPMLIGAAVGAVGLWRLLPTRWLPILVDVGAAALGVAAVLLLLDTGRPTILLVALLLGFGAGATVSPGLFLTGLGLTSDRLGRAFALVQLLRAMATYAVAPVVLQIAKSHGQRPAVAAMAVVAGVGLVVLLVVPLLSGARLRAPDLDAWLEGDKGLPSPATATHLRPRIEDGDAEPLLPDRMRERLRRRDG